MRHGLSPSAFRRMTPREVSWFIDGAVDRENREFQRLAQLACWVINPWLPKRERISVNKLLSRKLTRDKTNWSEWAK